MFEKKMINEQQKKVGDRKRALKNTTVDRVRDSIVTFYDS